MKSHLRKDEKFSQGVRLYAFDQIKLGRKAEDLEVFYNVSHAKRLNPIFKKVRIQDRIDIFPALFSRLESR